MDIRKVKKLIELLEESNVAEIEIKEGEETVRISRNYPQNMQPQQYYVQQPNYAQQPMHMAAPAAAARPRRRDRPGRAPPPTAAPGCWRAAGRASGPPPPCPSPGGSGRWERERCQTWSDDRQQGPSRQEFQSGARSGIRPGRPIGGNPKSVSWRSCWGLISPRISVLP